MSALYFMPRAYLSGYCGCCGKFLYHMGVVDTDRREEGGPEMLLRVLSLSVSLRSPRDGVR